MVNESQSVSEHELVEIRKLAMQIASKHDEGYVVGTNILIHNADAITDYIVTGNLPSAQVADQPETSRSLQGGR